MYNPNPGLIVSGQSINGSGSVVQAHTNGIVAPSYIPPGLTSQFPVNPDVKLRKLAFFEELVTLLKPSTLVPLNSNRQQEGTYYFHLTPQQATDIASNRDIRNSSKVEHIIQVQLRFCLLETTCEQEDLFPPNVSVKVNNKVCPLPNPIPTNKPGVEPKRPPRPVNITSNVKLSPTVANHISVSWASEFTRGYCVAAYLVKKLSSSQLLMRMRTKGIRSSDFTRGLIKEKLNEDADCEIATTMLKVSLVCPLGKMRMTTPCRAVTCSHLQCFDGSLYLQMNERKPTWNCPVCDKPAVYEHLVIDGYFQEVLLSPDLSPDTNEIQLHKDGSWSTHILTNDSQNLDTPAKQLQKVEIISDDIVLIEESPKSSIRGGIFNDSVAVAPQAAPTGKVEPASVDLTLSDSDDDMPQKSKTKAPVVAPAQFVTAPVPVSAPAPPAYTAKTNDNSIISLDSPSPPSSPVARTTMDPYFMHNQMDNPSIEQPQISPLASNYLTNPMDYDSLRIDPLGAQISNSLNFQSLLAAQNQQSGNNWLPHYSQSSDDQTF